MLHLCENSAGRFMSRLQDSFKHQNKRVQNSEISKEREQVKTFKIVKGL